MKTNLITKIRRYKYPNDKILLLVVSILGILFSLILEKLLPFSSKEFSPALFPFFIAPFFTLLWVAFCQLTEKSVSIFTALLVFGGISIPISPYFLDVFQANIYDDSGRYFFYAKYMIENKTLWGADAVRYDFLEHKSYATQPGYRYWDAIYLIVFGKPIRLIQFLNSFLFTFIIVFSVKGLINRERIGSQLAFFATILVVLSFPAGLKNCLQNLSEWLTVCILLCSAMAFLKEKYLLFASLFAFSVFFRQNLFFANSFLFLVILFTNFIPTNKKFSAFLVYILILLLPLYHNLYFDGNARFFVDMWQPYPYLKGESFGFESINFSYLKRNLLQNLGIWFPSLEQSILVVFIPFFIFFFFYYWLKMKRLTQIIIFIFTGLLFAPLILFDTNTYYPRFQYVVYLELLFVFLFYFNKSETVISY